MKKRMVELHLFKCERCGGEYLNEEEARQCESLPLRPPKFEVGSEVWKYLWVDYEKGYGDAEKGIVEAVRPCSLYETVIERDGRICCIPWPKLRDFISPPSAPEVLDIHSHTNMYRVRMKYGVVEEIEEGLKGGKNV
jgi:hypothetical protein